jgi:hypothetical protein
MGTFFLEVYQGENFEKKLERYEFNGREEFVTWADKNKKGDDLNDQVRSFQYCLPADWQLNLYIDRDPRSKKWSLPGTGKLEKVERMKKGFGHSVSGHKWVKRYALTVYNDNKWEKSVARFLFEYREEFVAWPDNNERGDRVSDRVKSCKYCLPKGWEVHIYKDRDPNHEDKKRFAGTGKKIKISEGKLLDEKASAHRWVKRP